MSPVRNLLLAACLCALGACTGAVTPAADACRGAGCVCAVDASCGAGFRCSRNACVALVLGAGGPGGSGASVGAGGSAAASGAGGSGGVAPARICSPGATQACFGPGQCSGAQVCGSDGFFWGACDCGAHGGGSGGTSGVGTGGGGAPAPNTNLGLWGEVDGVLEGNATPRVSALMGPGNQFSIADGRGITVAVWWPSVPATGSYPCVTGTLPGGTALESRGAGLSYGSDYFSWAPGGSCLVTVTELAPQSGGRVAGTFSGLLPGNRNGSRPPDPPRVTIMKGHFAVAHP